MSWKTGGKSIVGVFGHLDGVTASIEAVSGSGLKVHTVLSPVPRHEIQDALKLKPSPVRYFTLLGGISGLIFGVAFGGIRGGPVEFRHGSQTRDRLAHLCDCGVRIHDPVRDSGELRRDAFRVSPSENQDGVVLRPEVQQGPLRRGGPLPGGPFGGSPDPFPGIRGRGDTGAVSSRAEIRPDATDLNIRLEPARVLYIVCAAMVVIGVGAFIGGITSDRALRAWQAYLINFLFWSGLSFGSVLFVAILNMTNARWARPMKRLAEAPSAFLPDFVCSFLGALFRQGSPVRLDTRARARKGSMAECGLSVCAGRPGAFAARRPFPGPGVLFGEGGPA